MTLIVRNEVSWPVLLSQISERIRKAQTTHSIILLFGPSRAMLPCFVAGACLFAQYELRVLSAELDYIR